MSESIRRVAHIAITVLVISLLTPTTLSAVPNVKQPEPEAWTSDDDFRDLGLSESDTSFIQTLIAGIITFVIVVVAICLILCFCCPICIIAKMRQRRGVVIRSTAQPANGQTITVNLNSSGPPSSSNVITSPQVVAIPNNMNARNKPYPVQESVTVVPLLQPQQALQYPLHPQQMHMNMNMNYSTGAPYPPQNFELPPPYPGLAREADTANLPYNPYFSAENNAPTAPPPK